MKGPAFVALLGIAVVSACERRTSDRATTHTRPPVDVQRAAEPLVLTDILGRLAAADQFRNIIDLEPPDWAGSAHDSCESLGFPQRLPPGPASAAGPLAPGSTLTLVDRNGATPVVVRELGCVAFEEFEAASVRIHFDSARPIPPPSWEPVQGRSAPSELVVAGAVHPSARLRQPAEIDLGDSASADLRESLEAAIVNGATECSYEPEPAMLEDEAAERWAKTVVAGARASWIEAGARRLVFVVLADPCESHPVVAHIIDPESGRSLLAESASAAITLDALVDLDGDGSDELLVDIAWMEDGGEDLVLLFASAAGWTRLDLWSAVTP